MAGTKPSVLDEKIVKATYFRYAGKEYENCCGILCVGGFKAHALQQAHNQGVWNYTFIE